MPGDEKIPTVEMNAIPNNEPTGAPSQASGSKAGKDTKEIAVQTVKIPLQRPLTFLPVHTPQVAPEAAAIDTSAVPQDIQTMCEFSALRASYEKLDSATGTDEDIIEIFNSGAKTSNGTGNGTQKTDPEDDIPTEPESSDSSESDSEADENDLAENEDVKVEEIDNLP